MLKIGLLGYGQMGFLLKQFASEYQSEIKAIYDPDKKMFPTEEDFINCDVFIDFTQPDAVLSNIQLAAKYNKPIVVGTTGWYEHLPKVTEIMKKSNSALLYGSNFSLGMNFIYHIIDYSSKLFSKSQEYDAFGFEMHHAKKKDSPSGTAKNLCKILMDNLPQKKSINFDRVDRMIHSDELHFSSLRAGSIPGTHVVGFDSEADTIEIKHTARNRTGFAIGALKAAHWIKEKKGVFQFENIFLEMIK